MGTQRTTETPAASSASGNPTDLNPAPLGTVSLTSAAAAPRWRKGSRSSGTDLLETGPVQSSPGPGTKHQYQG